MVTSIIVFLLAGAGGTCWVLRRIFGWPSKGPSFRSVILELEDDLPDPE